MLRNIKIPYMQRIFPFFLIAGQYSDIRQNVYSRKKQIRIYTATKYYIEVCGVLQF
jgi:hypothetical protein